MTSDTIATEVGRVPVGTGLSSSIEPVPVSPADAASIPRAEHPVKSLLLWLAIIGEAAIIWSIFA